MKKIFIIFILIFIGNFVFGQELIVKPNNTESNDKSLMIKNNDSAIVKSLSGKLISLNNKQNPLTKKGTMFFFWGWNRAGFTNSDIHFTGNGYDFTLQDVVAHDRPSPLSWDYVDPGAWSKPQFVLRFGYFIKDNLAIVGATDHMKYVMDQDQTAKISGTITDPVYAAMIQNGQVNLTDEKFLTFEHTDGLNYVNVGLEKYKSLYSKEKIDILWSYGGGIGMMLPKSNVKLFGFERSDRFHVAGFGLDTRTNINFIFWKRWMARVEGKVGYINMPDVKTTLNNKPDKASHDFFFGQINFGIGYIFNQKRNKD